MKKAAAWLPPLLWMAFIFAMSAAPGEVSSEQSGFVTQLLARAYALLFAREFTPEAAQTLEWIVRKGAHMAEYAVLALLNLRALRMSGARRPWLSALTMAVLYAATDEFHQRFTPDRGPSPADVAIDALGASLGLLAARMLPRRRA